MMKRFFYCWVMCLMALTLSAQRAAVLEFKAGAGISQADVDGISAIFITYFRPEGYTMVERTQIDRVIDEQGFQRGKLTEQQMVKIGQILHVSKVVVGDINVVMGQYNVDVRALNVQSGTIAATEGATFQSSSYRASMQSIATKLAGKIVIKAGSTVPAAVTPSVVNGNEPTILYGYLKVFPNDLGAFEAKPTTIIVNINKTMQYGYGSWRLPTTAELDLMRANNLISGDGYMSSNGTYIGNKGKVRLVTDRQKGEIILLPAGYVDLGLSSGTIWKDTNEEGYYTFDEAKSRFGRMLPTEKQLRELKSSCQWIWMDNGYKVVGPNGESIFLPAAGGLNSKDVKENVNRYGYYWSSSKDTGGSYLWFYLWFNAGSVDIGNYSHYKNTVRLVQ